MLVLVFVSPAIIHVKLLLVLGLLVLPVEVVMLLPFEDLFHQAMYVLAWPDTMMSPMSNNALYAITAASPVLQPIQTA